MSGGGIESMAAAQPHIGGGANGHHHHHRHQQASSAKDQQRCGSRFQMPLHYPRFTRADYETMPEWKLDCLLGQYGLPVSGDLEQKRKFAMGAFLWQH